MAIYKTRVVGQNRLLLIKNILIGYGENSIL